ncbi:triple tyrosine motif-containing protein [Clostridium pasteurianum]|uniref:triple tyrosine motif-containing protein n=1 Tax=Clostridium pasteurianum TaxID=1501 RepID=UPI002260995A|nr:triple tyrosine motif-containing protein [Clostridium pasteurianum]UZW15612.1 triple tyrosine motif-containing protein [Clostridium pasteurianum]
MNELEINFSNESPQKVNSEIIISIKNKIEENLLYKYCIGLNGKWTTLKEFSRDTSAIWKPAEDGIYTIIVQAKVENEKKPFSYLGKADYVIGEVEKNIIKSVTLDRRELTVGEKITAKVETVRTGILFRYSIVENGKWRLLKDYSAENMITWTVTKIGRQEIVVNCKLIDSKEKFDDMKSVEFNVLPIKDIHIKDFRCLTEELFMDNEMIFQVDVDHDDSRLILYKFVKINSEGKAECIQNYSTKRVVSYVEKDYGEFKLLCLVKDMYSPKEYDDRALILYKIKKYKPVIIKNFTCDVISPQTVGQEINFKVLAEGGKELLYRFTINGNFNQDTGYIRNNNFSWKPKVAGEYKITLFVKDASFEENYEDKAEIEFLIDEERRDPVTIKEVITDKKTKMLIGDTINIEVIAEGGIELKYAFIVRSGDKELERIEYGHCNWVNYTPEKSGVYEIEVRVKDKFSEKEYDCSYIVYVEAFDYIPANIDYILIPANDYYMVGNKIEITVIAENTRDILNKYVLRINNRKVEETNYEQVSQYTLNPKCAGIYNIDIFAKNRKSDRKFDCKKSIKIIIHDSLPVTNTTIECDKLHPKINEGVTFNVSSEGGEEVAYEFYLMEQGEWSLVQKYSRKNFYTFMPFMEGNYKLLVLSKSQLNKSSYEDYAILGFDVEK